MGGLTAFVMRFQLELTGESYFSSADSIALWQAVTENKSPACHCRGGVIVLYLVTVSFQSLPIFTKL